MNTAKRESKDTWKRNSLKSLRITNPNHLLFIAILSLYTILGKSRRLSRLGICALNYACSLIFLVYCSTKREFFALHTKMARFYLPDTNSKHTRIILFHPMWHHRPQIITMNQQKSDVHLSKSHKSHNIYQTESFVLQKHTFTPSQCYFPNCSARRS